MNDNIEKIKLDAEALESVSGGGRPLPDGWVKMNDPLFGIYDRVYVNGYGNAVFSVAEYSCSSMEPGRLTYYYTVRGEVNGRYQYLTVEEKNLTRA